MHFLKAKKIFLKELQHERNVQAGFFRSLDFDILPEHTAVRITARTFYKLYINGEFAFYGPARGAHEQSRVDEIDIGRYIRRGSNALAIEIAGYNTKSLSVTGEYSFLQAEIEADGVVVDCTTDAWQGIRLLHKAGDTENFSHARCLSEVYDLDADYYNWRVLPVERCASARLQATPTQELSDEITLLPRGARLPDYQLISYQSMNKISGVSTPPQDQWERHAEIMSNTPRELIEKGLVSRAVLQCLNDRYAPFIGDVQFGAGKGLNFAQEISVVTANDAVALDFDFQTMASAFPGIEFSCAEETTIDIVHADKLTVDGDFDPRNCYSIAVIRLRCEPGHYRFEAFEPYGLRYMRVIVRGARRFTLHDVFIRRCQYHDYKGGSFLCSDNGLNRIYDAARLALQMNTLDGFLDCPGRERGSWAMDSFWTARAARLLHGDCAAERAHLENYLDESIGKYFDQLPGCYPAGVACIIHNWTIFLGLQLYEYYRRTGDIAFLREHTAGIEWLVGTLSRFENKFGLLENLPEIVYVDGTTSCKDEYNQPISTGTNAAYALMLDELGSVLQRCDWRDKARDINTVIHKVCAVEDAGDAANLVPDAFSMDESGGILPVQRYSEAAQYLYMWFGITKREELPRYFDQMFDQFGAAPSVPMDTNRRLYIGADLPVGTAMRFEALYRCGEYQKLYNEITYIFLYMLDNGPGTLWEGWSRLSNVNHGYLSHVAVWLSRIFLGLDIPDAVDRTVNIAPHPCGLKWAKGYTVAGSGVVSVSWVMGKGGFNLEVSVPEGYRVDLTLPDEVYGWDCVLVSGGETMRVDTRGGKICGICKSFALTAGKGKAKK